MDGNKSRFTLSRFTIFDTRQFCVRTADRTEVKEGKANHKKRKS
jgi:hypothetical protein